MKPLLGKPKVGSYVYRGKDYLYDQIIVNEALQDTKNLLFDFGQEINYWVVIQITLQLR